VRHFLWVYHNFDFSSLSELMSLKLLKVLPFNFSKKMEVGVSVLGVIFVGMSSNTVMVSGVILPLNIWFDVE
jgi:hypothetical protein